MASLESKIHIRMERRPALKKFYRESNIPKSLQVDENYEAKCWVLGVFQEGDKDSSGPVFVVEYEDGSTSTADVGMVRFVDTTFYGDDIPMVSVPPLPCPRNCVICSPATSTKCMEVTHVSNSD